jgi:hypothetical protein
VSTLLPESIAQALRSLPAALERLGALPVSHRGPEAFDNFAVVFEGRGKAFTVVRDRGQFQVSGPSQPVLEQAGLWRTFPGVRELESALVAWLSSPEGPNNSSKPTPLRGAA